MLNDLIDISLAAGRAIIDIYNSDDFQKHVKADGSPVTAADAAAEAIILARLRAHYPSTPIVAEEEAAAGRIPDCGPRFFLVDPLDGTKEFLNRNGDFTVNIALIEGGVPTRGVVYAPAHGLIYAGEFGAAARMANVQDDKAGAWRTIQCRVPPADGLAVLASRAHTSPETLEFIERFKVADMVSAGSSLKFCRVAEGVADLYPRLGRTMEWDTAAGDAVVRAAGGGVYTLDGAPLRYGKCNQATDTDYANPWFVAAGRFNPFAMAS
jgi:3'(2'),5'-bisphosphate nucleotidase